MVRTRTRQKTSAHTTSASASTTTPSTPSISSLLSKAQDLIIQCDYSLARKFSERVLAREDATSTEKSQAREMLAVTLLETGDVDSAKEIFLTLVPPHPEAPSPPPPSAYLYLAQLTDDDPHAALAHYQSAIDLLQTQLKGKSISTGNTPEDDDDAEIKGNIVRAYLGMIEIWMDPEYDLWQAPFFFSSQSSSSSLTPSSVLGSVDPAASTTCDALLSHALQIDPQHLEALQTLASVRLSQEKPDEALLALRTFPSPPVQDDSDAATADPRSHAHLLLDALPIQTRIARAKLLLECGAYPDALSILEGVVATDDTIIEGWYLMGWTWWLLAERKKEDDVAATVGPDEDGRELEWQDMARDARDCLETCQTLHASQGHPDIPLVEHVKELISSLDALGIQPSPLEEEDDNDGEWEEVSEDDGENEDIEMT
ncbi:TPR-like protein [Boletus reticuloceps]|uniref:TPR-like protein n=1 Tax=Boletus reticuloceps TaxID=495285 RepID=A0A8I2YJY0_9AGAM|nr:TPR-like protein [Boletus reticuloceps]